ncbi:hypothetical protein Goshw_014543 [Gossypium schwendimanii]|uniref:Uncharacterized protein n=1 Tax=Gossypium schwendimanii TaxID=34291 RepID=A0A7J9L315_GOSSC|nr:hypothetical protein [Gossypium schwendimanii]
MNSTVEFQESRIDKYLQQIQPYRFNQEQGFDLLMRNYKGLCKRAGVPMEQLDKETNPLEKLLGEDVYKQ